MLVRWVICRTHSYFSFNRVVCLFRALENGPYHFAPPHPFANFPIGFDDLGRELVWGISYAFAYPFEPTSDGKVVQYGILINDISHVGVMATIFQVRRAAILSPMTCEVAGEVHVFKRPLLQRSCSFFTNSFPLY